MPSASRCSRNPFEDIVEDKKTRSHFEVFDFPHFLSIPVLLPPLAYTRQDKMTATIKSLLAQSTRLAKPRLPVQANSIQTSATRNAGNPPPAAGNPPPAGGESITVASSAFLRNSQESALATPGLRFLDGNPNNTDSTRETKKMK